MKKPSFKIHSTINFKILVPTIAVVLTQSLAIFLILILGVKGNSVDPSLIENFESSINVRKNYVETSMSNKWANISDFYDSFLNNTKNYLNSSGDEIDDVLSNKSLTTDLLLNQLSLFPDMIERNHVNDAFLVLDTSYSDEKEMVYLRAKNPLKSELSEIEVIYSPYKVFNAYYQMGLNLSSRVDSNVYSEINDKEFFTKTIETATKSIEMNQPPLGYWACTLNVSSNQVLTYSFPVVIESKVIGVLGIGLTEQYLRNYVADISLEGDLNFALIKRNQDASLTAFNAFIDYSLPDLACLDLNDTSFENVYSFNNEGKEYLYFEDQINVYNGNTSFQDEWFMVGVADKSLVLAGSNKLCAQAGIVLGVSSLVAIIALVFVSEMVSKPIRRVSKAINEENLTNIPSTNIAEVDALLAKVESSINENVDLHDKFSHILEDSSARMAFLEYSKAKDEISTTSNFYKMLGLENVSGAISSKDFLSAMANLKPSSEDEGAISIDLDFLLKEGTTCFRVDSRYIQFKVTPNKDGSYATLIDLTEEYEAKREVERERDHDVLTGLLSRRGFLNKVRGVFANCSNGALLMIDVDNLKLINDRYGHRYGDEYLKMIGAYFQSLSKSRPNLLAGHLSGDEFIFFFYDYAMEEEDRFLQDLQKVDQEYFLFEGSKTRVSFSAGVCRFEKGIELLEMRNRADFAMYEAKRSGKNRIVVFDDKEYEEYRKQNLLSEELNEIITKELLVYAYQPIADLRSGEVLGYEALMRPSLPGMTPLKIIEAAKRYNRLYDIEYLTFNLASKAYVASKTNKKLFINSISSQLLSDPAWEEFKSKNSAILDKVVVEIIEEDFGQGDIMAKKVVRLDGGGIDYAIDDYGTGFNNISMVLNYAPKYIKIEGSLIRGIDTDLKKQQLTRTIVSYCKVNNIQIVAEAVETYEELKFVKEVGCDYAQGYFISKPKFEIEDIPEDLKETIRKA